MNRGIQNIRLGIDALATALDFGHDASEEVLNHLENAVRNLSTEERDELRRKMIFIIAQLSRLEVRLMGT